MHPYVVTSVLLHYLILFGFIFSGILLSYHKKYNVNVLVIKSFIRSATYLLITLNLLKYICRISRISIRSGDTEKRSCS